MNEYHTKVCSSHRAFLNELFVYESAFPNKANLIEIKKTNTLILSKIDGIPYPDVTELSEDIVAKLAQAISKLHSIQHLEDTVLCHWDNQPRNILWDEQHKKIWLIDFEDIRLAHPEADIAHLFLFWAEIMNAGLFIKLVHCFLLNYKGPVSLKSTRWERELTNAKKRFDERRKRHGKTDKIENNDRQMNRMSLHHLLLNF